MKKVIIVCLIILIPIVLFSLYVYFDNSKLYATVEKDFLKKYPNYKLIDRVVGEGDIVAAYVHVMFKKPNDTTTYEEIWQYWSASEGWESREYHLKREQ